MVSIFLHYYAFQVYTLFYFRSLNSIFFSIVRINMTDVFKNFKKYVNWLYLQYVLITAQYVMEPFERKLFNTVLLFIIVLTIYSAFVFLPAQMIRNLIWINDTIYNANEI